MKASVAVTVLSLALVMLTARGSADDPPRQIRMTTGMLADAKAKLDAGNAASARSQLNLARGQLTNPAPDTKAHPDYPKLMKELEALTKRADELDAAASASGSLDASIKKAAGLAKSGRDTHFPVATRIKYLEDCVALLEKLFASNPKAKQHAVAGTTGEKVLADCKQGVIDTQASDVAAVHAEAQTYAAKYPAAAKKYDAAMKERSAKKAKASESMQLASYDLRAIEPLISLVKRTPAIASKPCGAMTCEAMAKQVRQMLDKLSAEGFKASDERMGAEEQAEKKFIAAMKGARKTVAKERGGTPSSCNGDAPSVTGCAKANVWLYTIGSTNPNGGDDIMCEYRYVFTGEKVKASKPSCR